MKRLSPSRVVLVVLIATAFTLPISAQDAGDEISEAVATIAGAGAQGPVLRFPYTPEFDPVGSYSFSVLVGNEWQPVGAIEADAHMRPGEIDLTEWATGSTMNLRIARTGGGMAHVDALMVNGNPPLVDDPRLAGKLGQLDYDVLDDSEVVGVWTFETEPNSRTLLQFTGRIEPSEIIKEPFLYPLANIYTEIGADSEFYDYTVGSRPGRFEVDGSIDEESLGAPLFSEWFRVGTGHPQGSTFGWIQDDGESLFVAIDFTADNSIDGEVDYSAVYVNTPSGVREFRVSIVETRWGQTKFAYTPRVPWEHKTYEFAIPFAELSISPGDELELAFAAYGTGGPPLDWHSSEPAAVPPDPNGVEPNSGASGTTFTFLVTYFDTVVDEMPQNSQVWIDIDDDGVVDQPAGAATFAGFAAPNSPVGGGLAAVIMVVCAFAMALLLVMKRRRFTGIAVVIAIAAALTSCGAMPGVELFEMQHTGGSPFGSGAHFSTDVVVTADPGTYNFRFVFTTGTTQNIVIPADDTATYGPASGWMTFDISP